MMHIVLLVLTVFFLFHRTTRFLGTVNSILSSTLYLYQVENTLYRGIGKGRGIKSVKFSIILKK